MFFHLRNSQYFSYGINQKFICKIWGLISFTLPSCLTRSRVHLVLFYVINTKVLICKNETKYLYIQFKRIANWFLPNTDTLMTNKIEVTWMWRKNVKLKFFFILQGEFFKKNKSFVNHFQLNLFDCPNN